MTTSSKTIHDLPLPQPASSLPQVEELTPVPDVVATARALSSLPRLLLLESALQREPVGRYSFLMADPVQTWQRELSQYGEDPFTELELALHQCAADTIADLPPFQGGIAGFLGYELGHCFEQIPSACHDEFQLPVMAAGLYDWVIAWDHLQRRAWLISQGWPESDPLLRTDRASRRMKMIQRLLSSPITPPISSPSNAPQPMGRVRSGRAFAPQFPIPGKPELTSNFTREGYLQAVERVVEYIRAGDIFQANLTQRLLYPSRVDSLTLYDRLRRVNPAPFAGLMQWDDWAIISASPERFLRVDGREVETRPIKGTRRRNRGPEADLFTRDELRESEKDQAENVMIVDLLRNDLSRVCEAGSIRVPQLCGVETYETVQHLVSEVRGRLRIDQSVWDLFRATCPGGSITGAPKVRAMQIIAELEPTVRGPYCGSLFYAGANGQTDSNLLIRTFVQRDGWLQCGVGGGIVAQSSPVAEYEETLIKAAGMLKALYGLGE
jgi:para-aminobenzoate synthetase component 1